MEQVYTIKGMTCTGCVASVMEKLVNIPEVNDVKVDLENAQAYITMETLIPLEIFKSVLPDKFTIAEKGVHELQGAAVSKLIEEKSKLQQLKPLLLIFIYLFGAAFLLNFRDWNNTNAMLDFMGLFYIVFSFFKLLDLKGFPDSFRMYDPMAKVLPAYGWVYPFIELGLGLMFLFRVQITVALMVTVIVLGVTTIGVSKTLVDRKSIRCACLGTALKLPMTEATFIENAIMLMMAGVMLILG